MVCYLRFPHSFWTKVNRWTSHYGTLYNLPWELASASLEVVFRQPLPCRVPVNPRVSPTHCSCICSSLHSISTPNYNLLYIFFCGSIFSVMPYGTLKGEEVTRCISKIVLLRVSFIFSPFSSPSSTDVASTNERSTRIVGCYRKETCNYKHFWVAFNILWYFKVSSVFCWPRLSLKNQRSAIQVKNHKCE